MVIWDGWVEDNIASEMGIVLYYSVSFCNIYPSECITDDFTIDRGCVSRKVRGTGHRSVEHNIGLMVGTDCEAFLILLRDELGSVGAVFVELHQAPVGEKHFEWLYPRLLLASGTLELDSI